MPGPVPRPLPATAIPQTRERILDVAEALFAARGFAALFFFVAHVFVVLYEEPTLRDAFGADHAAYCGEVGRWWPRIR